MTKSIVCIFLCSLLCIIQGESEIEKLKRIIHYNIEKAKDYELPKVNSEIPSIIQGPPEDFGAYDFIVVGAGSSGSVVASRLSEMPNAKILLLEAGEDSDEFTDVPDMIFWSLLSERNWGYYSTPQTTCCQGMVEKKCFYPRGKVLGGTGAINAIMYARGNTRDFDKWEEQGNTGWSYKDVLPYFRKSENFTTPNQDSYHGYSGPLDVQYAQSQFHELFGRANEELGIHSTDYNGKNQMGYSKIQFTLKEGKRATGNTAFLRSSRNRKNLNISTRSFVTKLLIENEIPEVKGVQFLRNGKIYYARVEKEVILSAGAINSPQILMLSGIGPRHDLEKLGISVIKDLPVGKNLKDHINYLGLNFRTSLTEKMNSDDEILKQFLNGKGQLTASSNLNYVGFHKTNENQEVPDIEYILMPPTKSPFGNPVKKVLNVNDDLFESFWNKLNQSTDFTIFMIFLHPESSGSVSLKSKNPLDFPLIDLNYFSDEQNNDLQKMYEGIQFILKLIKTKSFQAVDPKLIGGIEKCEKFDELSKEFWFCALRTLASSSYHPMSTTRMGTSVANSVVDSNLKVHGVRKLRVADAGVFPAGISGHPNAACFMVGEKISDVLKKEYSVA